MTPPLRLRVVFWLAGAVLAASVSAQTATTAAPTRATTADLPAGQGLRFDVRGTPLTLDGSYEATLERRQNFDLDTSRDRGRKVLEQELKAGALWQPREGSSLYLQAVALAERRTGIRDNSVAKQTSFERGQTWWLQEGLGGTPLSLQLGRIALAERRSWWWDDELDAARLGWRHAGGGIDTGIARELAKRASIDRGIAPALQKLTRWFGHATQNLAEDHLLEAFWLLQRDRSATPAVGALFEPGTEDGANGSARWFGVRSSGEWKSAAEHRLGYRVDAALLRGRATRTPFTETPSGALAAGNVGTRKLRASAWDLGLQWRLPGQRRPTFSASLARGSGGADDGSTDRNFRQTGLQENKARVGGAKRIRYYGELLDPELSNLRVASLGFGLRVLTGSSVELLLHRYRQVVPTPLILGSRLGAEPAGTQRDIGREIDLLFALREWQHLELTLRLAQFRPGAAFAPALRSTANSAELGIALSF